MSSFDDYLKSIGSHAVKLQRPRIDFGPDRPNWGDAGLQYGQVISSDQFNTTNHADFWEGNQPGYADSANRYLGAGDLQSNPNMQTAYANYAANQPLLKAQQQQAQQQALLAEQQLIQQRQQARQQNFPGVQSIPQGPGLLQQAPQQGYQQQAAPQSLYRGGASGGLLGGGLHRGGGQQ